MLKISHFFSNFFCCIYHACLVLRLAWLSDAKKHFAAMFLLGKDADGRRKPKKKETNNDKQIR